MIFPLQTKHLDLQLLDDRLINAKQTDPNELFDKTDEKVNKPGKLNESVHTKLSNKTE